MMQNKSCCFFGHREINETDELRERVTAVIERLIKEDNVDTFLFGSKSRFDSLSLELVTELKQKYPHICYSVALAYMPGKGQKYELYSQTETFLPEGIENVPRRFAISYRNKWMVKESDIVVCYITHLWGGAAQFAEYAQRQGKEVINLAGSDVQIGTGNELPRRLPSGSQ